MKKLLLFLFCIPLLGITQNSHTINTAGSSFSPSSLTINVGDTVTWNNTGGNHNVNATQATFPNNPEGFGNSVGSGWTFQWIFTLDGTYDYQCDPHAPSMSGVIIANALLVVPGCTDPNATNYDPTSTVDDGSCIYYTLATDLFISEYAEGSGTNKYIEIFNGTGQDVDLSNYQLWKVTNGGSWPEYNLNLSGNLADGHVYIIYSSSSTVDPVIAAAGDVTWSQVTWTGDDAIGLAKQVPAQSGSSFVLIDAIGEDGPDPGNGWNVAGVSDATKDHTLVRKCSIIQGNINWNLSSGTNAQDSEWEVLSQNYWTDIDQHTFPCQAYPVYGCTDSTAINFDPFATIDNGSCISLTFGCTDSTAFNYNATANSDDGSCCFQSGCTDPAATNYDPSACYNDGSCITPNFGCMNASAMNFDSTANIDDGSCILLADKIDLFFSEYGEGSSNNKYIEIYNSTSYPIDLSSYALTRVSNAPTTVGVYEYWVDFDSAAVISANDVYIVAHPSSDSVILSQADMTYSILSNGDDGFALVYGGKPSSPVLPGNEYIILDFLGDFNGDPGSGWSVAGITNATKDHTLVRKCSINTGNTNWTTSAGTDSLNSEWTVFANNYSSNISQHTNPCQNSPVYGCTNPTSCNYDPLATIDDGSCWYLVADFSFTNTCQADPTLFTNLSIADTTIISYWDMGGNGSYVGGTNSSSQNPSFLYDSCGIYYVSLIVTDANGCADTIMSTIEIYCAPIASFSADTVCLGTPTSFLNLSAGGVFSNYTMYTWDFGDGWISDTTTGSVPNQTYLFDQSGIYIVTLTLVDNNGCSDSFTNTVLVNSCTCANAAPTGLNATNVLQNRATINWDNMNDTVAGCMVDQYRIAYSDDGGATWSSKTMGQPVNSCLWATQNTDKLILNLTPSTTYTYRMKAWYCDGSGISQNSAWSAMETFTTEDDCPNVGNLVVTTPTTTKANFTWDDSYGAYSFTRIKMRVDTNNSTWFNVGGSGVSYGIFTKDKNNLTPGTSYRGQSRTWCSPNGGAWKSPTWSSLLFWTQPTTIRLEGGSDITYLDVYPNPSRDIFNVSLTSEDKQTFELRVLNTIGEIIFTENKKDFIGEYSHQFNLSEYSKGVYFLEIVTENRTVNKKLILQ